MLRIAFSTCILRQMAFTAERDPSFLQRAKQAFIEREEKPTYQSLSDEFDVPLSTIGRASVDENWVSLRAADIERKALENKATQIVLSAANTVNQPIMNAAQNAVLLALQKIALIFSDIDDERAPSTRAQTVNTLSFAFKNICDGCKSMGIGSLPKKFAELSEGGAGWSTGLMQQINVHVAAQQAAPAQPKPAPTVVED